MADYRDCVATYSDGRLRIGNAGIERVWDLSQGAPTALSVRDKARGREWVGDAPFRDAFRRADLPLIQAAEVAFEAAEDDALGASEPHLKATVTLRYPNAELIWTHRVWPELPVVLSGYVIRRLGDVAEAAPEQFSDSGRRHVHPIDDRLDFFGLAPMHLSYRAVAFTARTDYNDNLVREQRGVTYPKAHLRIPAHWLHVSDRAAPGGLLAVKIAPPPDEQLAYPGMDFFCSGRTLATVGSGIIEEELAGG